MDIFSTLAIVLSIFAVVVSLISLWMVIQGVNHIRLMTSALVRQLSLIENIAPQPANPHDDTDNERERSSNVTRMIIRGLKLSR